MRLKLRYYGDPILREVADPVDTFDEALREQAESMIETMREENGIGLAGPQVGYGRRLIIALRMSDPDDSGAAPLVLVNPEVTERSGAGWELEEGCLSIPGITGEVTRALRVNVNYQDLDGESHALEAEGMFARVILHEIDHLNGRLFIDYLSSAKKSLLKPQLKKIAEMS